VAKITTHALDIVHGRPAAGMRVVLRRQGAAEAVADVVLNADGRTGAPLLDDPAGGGGVWELEFHLAAYFAQHGLDSPFLEVVPIRFRVVAGERYHVPLVCSPWAYQTYRGS
jgi:5-hydroxyisourate hydrolase